MTKTRPTGVTVLAVLSIISGVLSLLGGFGALLLGGLATVGGAAQGNADAAALGIVAVVIAVTLLITGALSLVVAYGLWTLRGWAWITAIVLQVIGLAMNGFNLFQGSSGAVFSIAIAVVVLYYLFRPNVKEAFGKA